MGVQQQLGRLVGHMLSASVRRDGVAATLQRESLEEGRRLAVDAAPARSVAATSDAIVLDCLSAKVLGAWVQNRHQTLYPLAMNLRNQSAGQIATLLDLASAALLATGSAHEKGVMRVCDWLATVGGDETHRARFRAALDSAPSLHETIGRVLDAHLGPFGFAVALAALDQRESVNRLFLEFLAVRFGLPSDMSRSLAQRYRL